MDHGGPWSTLIGGISVSILRGWHAWLEGGVQIVMGGIFEMWEVLPTQVDLTAVHLMNHLSNFPC